MLFIWHCDPPCVRQNAYLWMDQFIGGGSVAERANRRSVCQDGMIGEVSGDDLRQPFPRFGNRPLRQNE
jgi:hypothetical protein